MSTNLSPRGIPLGNAIVIASLILAAPIHENSVEPIASIMIAVAAILLFVSLRGGSKPPSSGTD